MPIFDGIAPRNGPERHNDMQLYDFGEGAILHLCSLGPVENQDSTRSLFVIQASDGTIRFN
jgi:hypothetical protein